MNLITGVIKPNYGNIVINNEDITQYPIYVRTKKFKISSVPQIGGFFSDLSAEDNLNAVGEILINCIDKDGKANGYDIDTIEQISKISEIPIIACGGAGHQVHFFKAFEATSASAIAAGNIFHFKENAYPLAKNYLKNKLSYIR